LIAPYGLQRLEGRLPGDAAGAQQLSGLALHVQHGQEKVLGAGELVLQAIGLLLRLVEDLGNLRGHRELSCIAVHLGLAVEGHAERVGELRGVGADSLEQGRDHSSLLLEQREQQVLDVEAWAVQPVRKGIR
jgi:hypothetical protein